jgi:hypothetical protein
MFRLKSAIHFASFKNASGQKIESNHLLWTCSRTFSDWKVIQENMNFFDWELLTFHHTVLWHHIQPTLQ